jgi:hypothetical protein
MCGAWGVGLGLGLAEGKQLGLLGRCVWSWSWSWHALCTANTNKRAASSCYMLHECAL